MVPRGCRPVLERLMTSLSDVREAFLGFFEEQGHQRVASAPLVPKEDPSLLFVNAGMVPFKSVFTGASKPSSPRATSSQKCVRAGGKHNDLDNVGYTARHHTFFEMLGNFSFGDYFKDGAIELAWDFVTKTLDLSPGRLLVTVYSEDDEAAAIWSKVAGLPASKIIRIPTADNFWSMGETGPCGPSSEIFFDHGPDIPGGPPGSLEEDGDRFVEIWNLVFMQFDQQVDGSRSDLPMPSIDTGMGLERISAVLQGVHNNYETDLFRGLIAAAEAVYGVSAEGERLGSFRVIADHLRASAFLIADGVDPSNEGRGYVLRRIMRRAMRHGHFLGAEEPKMHLLTRALVAEMGAAYPELGRAQPIIEAALSQEEERFQRTLGRGLSLLDEAAADLRPGDVFPGATAFKLYDTYGFPLDLTEDILRQRDVVVEAGGFEAAMARQRAGSRETWSGSGAEVADEIWAALEDRIGATAFSGYDDTGEGAEGRLLAIVSGEGGVERLRSGEAELVFDQTPFYAESGGQAGDHGEIRLEGGGRFAVRDVQKRAGGIHAHIGELIDGEAAVGEAATFFVDAERRSRLRANHSATHLLHAALRGFLGAHVAQKGSLVEEDKLRFDFSHGAPVTPAELEAIEDEVNAIIRQNTPTEVAVSSPAAAIEAGALALFGEKYGDSVRVLSMGRAPTGEQPYSVELCGGTHVARTGDIGAFAILAESGVSAGVRRIEAATGAEALNFLKSRAQVAVDAAEQLKTPLKDLPQRIADLVEARRAMEREIGELKRKLAMGGAGGLNLTEKIGGLTVAAKIVEDVPAKELRALVDEAKSSMGSGVAIFIAVNDGKAAISAGVTDDLTGRISAVDLVRTASAAVGGKGGGGRPDMAQAGGPDGKNAARAIEAVKAALIG